jgi:hypothetical protein
MTITIQHLAAAWKCAADLEQLGCRVLSVLVRASGDAPRIHIDDPRDLLDHLDAMSVDTSSVKYTQQAVQVDGCEVFWLIPAPAGRAGRTAAAVE